MWLWIANNINDIIRGSGIICVVFFLLTWRAAHQINKNANVNTKNILNKIIEENILFFHNVFLTIVSLFPLLGMLGTVVALLNLDFTAGNDENLKTNFFLALESTGLGLIFAILSKIIYGLIQHKIESAIEILELLKSNNTGEEECVKTE